MAGGRRFDEFEMIARYFALLTAREPGALGLRDDAATLDVETGRELVVTSDCLVAGVHFLADTSAADIAYRALAVNLSDLAATGARARAYILALALPKNFENTEAWIKNFTQSLNQAQEAFSVSLIGGDTVVTPGPLTLTVTAFGSVAAGTALRRSGARDGDRVFVSGTFGDAALGLRALQGHLPSLAPEARAHLGTRHQRPTPRLALGQALVGLASAAADVSDGLLADLGHICAASGLGAHLRASDVPLSPAAEAAIASDPELADLPLTGGDDYELVFTLPESAVEVASAAAADCGVAIHEVGRMTVSSGVEVVDKTGAVIAPQRTGFRHF